MSEQEMSEATLQNEYAAVIAEVKAAALEGRTFAIIKKPSEGAKAMLDQDGYLTTKNSSGKGWTVHFSQ